MLQNGGLAASLLIFLLHVRPAPHFEGVELEQGHDEVELSEVLYGEFVSKLDTLVTERVPGATSAVLEEFRRLDERRSRREHEAWRRLPSTHDLRVADHSGVPPWP